MAFTRCYTAFIWNNQTSLGVPRLKAIKFEQNLYRKVQHALITVVIFT